MHSSYKWRNIYLDYNSIAQGIDAIVPEITAAQYEALVILLRGGSFAGMHLAYRTGLPYYFLHYDRRTELIRWVGQPPSESRVLLCEDIAGKGKTLLDCLQYLRESGYTAATFTMCTDALSASSPDHNIFDCRDDPDARYIFPWERYRLNHEADHYRFDGIPEHHFERIAWNLDGIFIDNAEMNELSNTMEYTPPPANISPVADRGDMIISGRPTRDKEHTLSWLNKYQISLPIILRDDGIHHPSAESTARWKGRKAIELGFTHYVESDAEQALWITNYYPELRVIWWNRGCPSFVQSRLEAFS